MSVFRVWAPEADRVELHLDGADHEMTRRERGWWEREVSAVGPAGLYAYRLDGSQPLPDPRAPRLPRGPHGPAQLVDHDAFDWTDAEFSPPPLDSAVIYELHVGTFSPEGTFDGAIEKLGYLSELGVTHIDVMPVATFPGRRGWGYDGVGLFAPHEPYGGPTGFKRLVDAAHANGLAVILDVVYNHLGPEGNYLGRFGPYFTDRYRTPWGPAVNFDDAGSDEVRRFVVDNACMWLGDYHVDALRIDAVHAIYDQSAIHILEQLAREVRSLSESLGRRKWLIPESDLNNPRLVRPWAEGGYGLDAQWSDDFHHALHAVLTGERRGYYEDFGRLADLAKALREAYVYDGRYSRFRGRSHGRPPTGLGGGKFLAYIQNHDQVGNRAVGERISHLVSPGLAKVAAAVVLCSPYVPMLFAGEEFAASGPFQYFTDVGDEDLGRAIREGRRSEFRAFGWRAEDIPDPQDEETFLRSRLDWDEAYRGRHAEMLEWHRSLVALRRDRPELRDGRRDKLRCRYDEEGRWLIFYREALAVACNFAGAPQSLPLEGEGRWSILLVGEEGAELRDGGVWLPAECAAVLELA